MKTQARRWLAAALTAATGVAAHAAQPFDSGSSGIHGDLNVTASTNMPMPADGIFHFRSIAVNAGATVTFQRNPLNTPVYLLAQSNAVINGTIDVSGYGPTNSFPGSGGPGGFDGGFGGVVQLPHGDGKGPGGGRGAGAHGYFGYGNGLCMPLVGGSGGAGFNANGLNPGIGGAGGGGALLIAASGSITVGGSGIIRARGGISRTDCNGGGHGSGGAIRLVSPSITGSGTVAVDGIPYCGAYALGGRIRIDSLDRVGWINLQFATIQAVSFTRGSYMVVFPPTNRLDIIEAAGQPVPLDAMSGVSFTFPPGPSTNINVRVQALGLFYGATNVPIRVAVTPEYGAAANYDTAIDISQGATAATNVTVTLPAGTTSLIHAWTR